MRVAGAGSVNLGTRVRAGAVPGVDPDHWKRFPERRDRRGSLDGAAGGEAGGDGPGPARGAFAPPRGARRRGSLEAERRARASPGAARPGAWRLRGWRRRRQFGSQALGSAPRAQAASCLERSSSSTAPFSGAPGWGAVGAGAPRPRSPAGGHCFRVVADSCAFRGLPPRRRPQHVVKPPAFGCPAVGGAGGSEHFRVTSPQVFFFCSTRAPRRSHFSNQAGLPLGLLATRGVGSRGGHACPVLHPQHPRQVPTSEPSSWRS